MIEKKDLIPGKTVLVHRNSKTQHLVLGKSKYVLDLSKPDTFFSYGSSLTLRDIRVNFDLLNPKPDLVNETTFEYHADCYFWDEGDSEAFFHTLAGYVPNANLAYTAIDGSRWHYASYTKPNLKENE